MTRSATERWQAWLAAFADRPGRSADDRLRAMRTAALCSLTLLVAPGFLGTMAWSGFTSLAGASGLILGGFAAPLALLRRGHTPALAGHLACALGALQSLVAAWFTTGLQGPSAIPVLLSPVAATLLVGPRAGWFWFGVAAATLGALLAVDDPGWVARSEVLGAHHGAVSLVAVLLLVGAVIQGSLGATVELEMAHRRDLDEAVSELERRVAARTADLQREVEERRRAEADAQRATAAKSVFLANMSHELRTPLTAILGYTELVREELGAGSGLRGDLDRVITAAGHLQRLIDDLLDVARVERAEVELVPVDLDVDGVVAAVADLMRGPLAAAGNRLVLDPPAPGLVARADPTRTRQILLNLLSNASKFTERGTVALGWGQVDQRIEIRVADTGVGIAPADLDRVFERFVQVDDSPTRRQGGAGLGLALARELARSLGGDVTARSTPGVGSTFTLSLPATRRAEG